MRTYRLDGEGHAGAHRADGLVLRVVRDVGRGVEEVVDAVSAVRAHDRATILSCNWLTVCGSRGRVSASGPHAQCHWERKEWGRYAHYLAEVAEERAGLADLDRLVEAFARRAHEPLRIVVDAPDRVCFVEVGVVPCKRETSVSHGSLHDLSAYHPCRGTHLCVG